MNDTHTPPPHPPRRRYVIAGGILLLLTVCYALFQVTVRSPFISSWLERNLTTFLQQPVSLQGVHLTFATITINQITIRNPAGFVEGNLAIARGLRISPDWPAIVRGKKAFRQVALAELSVDLRKNRNGEWNHAPLLHSLSRGKGEREPSETIVGEVKIDKGSVKVNGTGVDNLRLRLADIATKGSANTSLELSADVPGGSLTVSGTGRLGVDPFADLVLRTSSLSLAAAPAPKGLLLAGATGRVAVKTHLRNGVVTGMLASEVAGVKGTVRNRQLPLAGTFHTAFRYLMMTDRLELTGTTLQMEKLLDVHGTARVERLRTERNFTADLTTSPLSIAGVAEQFGAIVPAGVVPSGQVLPLQLHFAGNGRKGLTVAQGRLSLRNGRLERNGTEVVRDLAADVRVSKRDGGWSLDGKLNQGSSGGNIPVHDVTSAFSARLTDRFNLAEFEAAPISARVFGSPLTGRARYRPAASTPFTALLDVPRVSLPKINALLGEKVQFTSGELSVTAQAAGRAPNDFNGTAHLALKGTKGRYGVHDFGLEQATTSARIVGEGSVRFAGSIDVDGASFDVNKGGGSFRYDISRTSFSLREGTLRLAGHDLRFGSIAGSIPLPPTTPSGTTPIHVRFDGTGYRKGAGEIRNAKGTIDALLFRDGGRKWVNGGVKVAGADVLYRNEKAGVVDLDLSLDEKAAHGKLTGTLFGGTLIAIGQLNPYDSDSAISFDVQAGQIQAAGISRMTSGAAAVTAVAGTVDAFLKGMFTRPNDLNGLAAVASVSGKGLSLKGRDNRTIVSGAGFTAGGEVAGGTVAVKNGRLWASPAPQVQFSGEISRAFSPERQGVVKLAVPVTPVAAFLDAFANVLPRPLQEATVAGALSADSVLRIRGKKVRLDGDAALSDMLLDVPAQKVSVSGIGGRLPFSLVYPVPHKAPKQDVQHPSRESYAGYLHFLQSTRQKGIPLVIDKVRFGPLELGRTVLHLEAEDGVTRIDSFNSTLAEGILVGRGYFEPGRVGNYGGDLLVGDLSLRAFCAAVPAIKDYLSGKVDGIVSIAGAGKGVAGMTAFIDLWARGTREEKMLVSKEFLQKLAGKNLRGIFFRKDRSYDRGEISGYLRDGYLTFETLDITHTNFFGVKDLSVSVAPVQNKISLDHLMTAVKEAAARGKGVKQEGNASPQAEFSWEE